MVRIQTTVEPTLIIINKKIKKYYIHLYSQCMQRFFPKSILGFRFWTFFLSIFENPKDFCAKSYAKHASYLYALKIKKSQKKVLA